MNQTRVYVPNSVEATASKCKYSVSLRKANETFTFSWMAESSVYIVQISACHASHLITCCVSLARPGQSEVTGQGRPGPSDWPSTV